MGAWIKNILLLLVKRVVLTTISLIAASGFAITGKALYDAKYPSHIIGNPEQDQKLGSNNREADVADRAPAGIGDYRSKFKFDKAPPFTEHEFSVSSSESPGQGFETNDSSSNNSRNPNSFRRGSTGVFDNRSSEFNSDVFNGNNTATLSGLQNLLQDAPNTTLETLKPSSDSTPSNGGTIGSSGGSSAGNSPRTNTTATTSTSTSSGGRSSFSIINTVPSPTPSPSLSLVNSSIIVSANTVIIGNPITVTMIPKDTAGNSFSSGGLTVGFSNIGGTSNGTFSVVTDHGDGTYSSVFTASTIGAATEIEGTIQGNLVSSSFPSVTVVAGVPLLSFSGASGTSGTVGTAMSVTPTTLNSRGAAITGCSIKAATTALPAWASLNNTTCVISGTPSGNLASTSFTIDAINAVGSSSDAVVSLSVVSGVPVLSYAGSAGTSGTVGTAMSVSPATLNNQGGAITNCAIKIPTTSLPAWATLNTSTCVITGTPTSTQSATTYTIDATNRAGVSSDATVSLTVGAGVPILSYSGAAGTSGTVGTAFSVSPTTLNNQGAAITGCAIKASTTPLPAWAILNTTTCAIAGTPNGTLASTTYTIDATNSAGTSGDATVSLTVGAGVPVLSYSGSAGTSGTVGTAMSVTPTTLNTEGSAITGCAIKASTTVLPAWASLNTSTCAITGSPTGTLSSTTYTIDATNSAGTSSDATVSLTVGAGIPVLSYSGSAGTSGTVGSAMSVSPSTLNNQGSAITGCAIKASTAVLPAWATLNTTTCVITGTPTGTLASTTYTIDATNSAGTSSDATVSLTVGAGVPILSYSGSAGTSGTVGTALSVSPTTLNNQGSAITGCVIKVPTTALPAWATLNATTCVITGTPTGVLSSTSYTIDATNSAGTSSDATVTLSVGAGVPILSYSGASGTSGTVGTAMSVTPTTLNNQGAAITGCAIRASTTALPAWATLNTSTCVITGTPTGPLASTTYTIDATNSAGTSSDATVSLTVGAGVPILSYSGSAGTSGTVGTAFSVSPTTLNNQGAAITGCAIRASTTALPAWASLNTSTCAITGTPTSTQSATSYTIDATNSAGTSSDATVSLTVGAGVPILSYSGSAGTSGTVGTAFSVSPTTLNNQGSAITGCVIKVPTTALPAWATLNATTCVITGTPTGVLSSTSYTIDATNSAGTSSDATVTLSVGAGVPILSYSGASGTSGTVGTAMSVSPTTLNNQGGAITNCAIKVPTTALPTWATLNTSTCVITGTPTGTQSATTYTIDATNSAGISNDATVSLTVTAGIPILSYSTSTGTAGAVGTAMSVTPSTLNNQGGAITGCAIKAFTTAFPAWASLNATTCAITGTPTGVLSSTTYTIDATNSAGTSSDATVSLSVTYPVPTITAISPATGSDLGGTSVTITGTGFYSGAAVTLAATACSSIVINTTTSITCTTPAHAAGAVSVNVSNMGTSSGTLSNGFTYTTSSFTQTWSMASSTGYTYNSSKIDFSNGYAELTPAYQTDSSDTGSNSFFGGSLKGTAWDTNSNSYIRLEQVSDGAAASDLELDSSWTPAWTNLTGLWHFDEATSGTVSGGYDFADSSGGGNPGTEGGSLTIGATGVLGAAISLNGSSTYADIVAPNSNLNFGSDYTLSAWIKTTTAGWSWIITRGGSSGVYLGIDSNGNLVLTSPLFNDHRSTGNIMDGLWHYVVATLRGGNLVLYKDGVSVGSWTGVATPVTSGGLYFGQRSDNVEYFNGLIDEAATWNTALSANAVATIYQHQISKYTGTFTSRVMDGLNSTNWTALASKTTLPYGKELPDTATSPSPIPVSESSSSYTSLSANLMTGIVGLWHLDEPSGTVGAGSLKDQSGNSNHLTPNNVILGNYGKFGTAPSFNGSNSSLTGNSSPISGGGVFTFSTWFKTNLQGTRQGVFWMGGAGVNTCAEQVILPNNTLVSASCNGVTSGSTGAVTDGAWHHAVTIYDGSSLSLYFDGRISGTPAGVTTNLASTVLSIGLSGDVGDSLKGMIDETAVWSRALSSSEVLELYRRGANRIKYQVRSCPDSTCSTSPSWLGPDGSNQSYFSELNNNALPNDGGDLTTSDSVNAASPTFTFANFTATTPTPGPLSVSNNRYFQYRAIMESDDTGTGCNYGSGATWCSPELQNVTAGPNHYDTTNATITNTTGVSFSTLTSLVETLGTGGCSQGTLYNLSPDGTNWYWYNAGSWQSAAGGTIATATAASSITGSALAMSPFAAGGTVYFKVFLQSSGTSGCVINSLAVGGTQ